FLACVLLNMIIIIPFFLIFSAVIHQGILSFNLINNWINDGNIERLVQTPFISYTLNLLHKQMEGSLLKGIDFHSLMVTLSSRAGELMVSQGKYIISNISAVVGKFCLMTFVFFFVIQDQEKKLEYITHLVPLSSKHEKILFEKIKAVAKSAILGTLVTAISQGTAGGIAFSICGFPGFFWGAVMAFTSLIPLLGTALIWIPAAIWLFISGEWQLGLFLIVWSIVIVGMIDNIVRPLFMKGTAGMSTLLIFFSILGGLNYFGLTGLLYGPMVFGLTLVLLYIYELEFNAFLNRQDQN
ncbi:MAG: AI-2E family transporter, partial [Desulfamplus sp.]|nr:AI-2E family transporter [Desulfamplus sp.]